MPEKKQGLIQFYDGQLRPTTQDPYDRGHYVYGPDGKVLGFTPEYAKAARSNYDRLQKSIATLGSGNLLLGAPFFKHIPPVSAALWGIDALLDIQSKVPPPPGPVKK